MELHTGIIKVLTDRNDTLDGKEIRFIRKNLGFSQDKFADLLETTKAKINYMEENLKGGGRPMKITYFMDQWVWT